MVRLDEIRKEIDLCDKELVNLLEKRMNLVEEVLNYKKANDLPVLNSNREEQVIEKVSKEVKNKNYEDSIKETFIEIMRISKKYQSKGMH